MWRLAHRTEYRHICFMEEKVLKHKYVIALFWAVAAFLIIMILIIGELPSDSNNITPLALLTFLGVAAVYIIYCFFMRSEAARFLHQKLYVQYGICVWKKENYHGHGRSSVTVTITISTEDGRRYSDLLIPFPLHVSMELESGLLLVTPDPENCSDFHVYPAPVIQRTKRRRQSRNRSHTLHNELDVPEDIPYKNSVRE